MIENGAGGCWRYWVNRVRVGSDRGGFLLRTLEATADPSTPFATLRSLRMTSSYMRYEISVGC